MLSDAEFKLTIFSTLLHCKEVGGKAFAPNAPSRLDPPMDEVVSHPPCLVMESCRHSFEEKVVDMHLWSCFSYSGNYVCFCGTKSAKYIVTKLHILFYSVTIFILHVYTYCVKQH